MYLWEYFYGMHKISTPFTLFFGLFSKDFRENTGLNFRRRKIIIKSTWTMFSFVEFVTFPPTRFTKKIISKRDYPFKFMIKFSVSQINVSKAMADVDTYSKPWENNLRKIF